MLEVISFYVFAVITIVSFCGAVFSSNIVKSLASLMIGLVSISIFYFMLNAEFLAVIQIVVYSGSILALYGFFLMFIDIRDKIDLRKDKLNYILFGVIFIFLIFIIFVYNFYLPNSLLKTTSFNSSNINMIGTYIFRDYLLLFEITAIMLLVALICALVITSKKMEASFTFKSNKEIDDFIKLDITSQEENIDKLKKEEA